MAQALFDRAKKMMSAGNYAEACPALEESQRIEARSGTLLNLADCYEHTERFASAWSTFLEAATLAKANRNAERESGARERAASLAPRLSKLMIGAPFAASTPGLEITRDGERVGPPQLGIALPADARNHTIAARAPGRKPWQTEVTVPGNASTASVVVPELATAAATSPGKSPQLAARPPAELAGSRASPSRINRAVLAGGIVTGVLAVGTIVTGLLYSGKLHDYDAANDQGAPNRSELYSQTRELGVANLAFVAGTVVAAGVTVFLWTRAPAREAPKSASVELRGMVGPGLAGLSLDGRL
jgi:hypothetical protein